MSVDLDNALAAEYALYAMMSSNAYLKEDRTYFPIEDLGWMRVDLNGKSYNRKLIYSNIYRKNILKSAIRYLGK